ncbi:DUF5362 family protein [Mucilaginibacter panaciglaebae]|uniref:Uncharacterized protein n=1 Tax=Mucilaginibacter panaciglaebae TaxID=502331 RepID=A0ABP7WIJ2_9SPHI
MEETFTNQPNTPAQPQGIVLLQDAQSYLVIAGKWARFLGILGFIGTGLVVLCALFIGTIMSALTGFSPAGRMAMAPGGFLTFFYILIAIFYFFVSLYTYQFGARVREGVAFGSSAVVTDGLNKLKSVFKLVGIATIVIMILYVFILIGVIIFTSHMSHMATGY